MAAYNQDGITIGTISGGIVNFGGAVTIAPITITRTSTGSGQDSQGGGSTSSSGTSVSSLIREGALRSSGTGKGTTFLNEGNLTGIIDIIRRSLA
ncbi:hypothetical protein V7128_26725 [Neobacillus vireti]|uniref:hypothetical protein n=1 Tax=Neobacillus vireti TaxID=220686 RepID=UPI003000F59D